MRGYQLRHLGKILIVKNYLFAAFPLAVVLTGAVLGAALLLASTGATTAVFEFAVVSGVAAGVVVSVVVPVVELRTETLPLIAGIASKRAVSMKQIAAPIVILDKTDCVPRGPKAVLEILLVKSAPASALPGCSKIVATSTRQEIKNKAYNK